MGLCRATMVALALVSLMALLFPMIHGWGLDGHFTVCKIAQGRLSETAAAAVKKLLPASAENDLASVCIWADRIKFRYHWSRQLHYIDTPDKLCTYQYDRDCKDESGAAGRCVVGAINNYTSQLLTYKDDSLKAKASGSHNLTEALLFLSHFLGDIHQPLHVGFTSDRGGNEINVHWYRRKANLHHVWDTSIIETAEKDFYDSAVDGLISAIQKNITSAWADQIVEWETCDRNATACPDVYASEGIKAACDYAYKGVKEDDVLEDDYFLSRSPVIYRRLAQGGVRLAATLNRIFG